MGASIKSLSFPTFEPIEPQADVLLILINIAEAAWASFPWSQLLRENLSLHRAIGVSEKKPPEINFPEVLLNLEDVYKW